MSHASNIFNRVPIDLPNKSGFNLDHENLFTADCGTLTPCYSKPVLPNDTLSMGINFQVQLPPFVTDFYGKLDACFEAFFVPNRILWAGWEDFITHPTNKPVYPSGTPIQNKPSSVPTIYFNRNDQAVTSFLASGSLSDYLGFKKNDYSDLISTSFTALPFLAYHMIYHHWYRDSRIQSPLFYAPDAASSIDSSPANAPYVSIRGGNNTLGPIYTVDRTLGDGVPLGSLRQRNWSKGYFTTASPYPQSGDGEEVSIDVVDGTAALSIATLRSANAIQQWKERNNFSLEYADQIYGQYGIYPQSAKIDKPIYLGRVKQTIYSRSVMQTGGAASGSTAGSTFQNFVGGKRANGQAIGDGSLFQQFTPSEHGYIMVIFSLIPHSYYGTGTARHLYEKFQEDIPFPLLAGVGDQPIFKFELTGSGSSIDTDVDSNEIFGYTDRYAHYKYDEDEVHGLLRDGQNLASYAIQRSFGSDNDSVELGSEFLQIPKNAIDQVMQISSETIGCACWCDTFFKLSKISTLPAYSLPTLGDLKNTHKGSVSRGGSRL